MNSSVVDVSVVVATTGRQSLAGTLASIADQTLLPAKMVVINDYAREGAPWARNRGALDCFTEFLVFSDDDIYWEPHAFETLREAIGDADFAYGSYGKGPHLHCVRKFDPEHLRKQNYISTMSMVRRSVFPGFDHKLKRLQDWDLWLTMVEMGSIGVHCGELIFRTPEDDGISSGGPDDWRVAERAVKVKHGLIK